MNRRLLVFLSSITLLSLLLLNRAKFMAVQAQATDTVFTTPTPSELVRHIVPNTLNQTTSALINWTAPVSDGGIYAIASGIVQLQVGASSPDSFISQVIFERWDAVNNVWVQLLIDTSAPYQASVDVNTLNAGMNQIYATAYDAEGNSATSYIWINKQTTFACNNVTEIPKTECEALVALYNSTNGTNWINRTGWLTTNTPCSWYGITCYNHVTAITLPTNQLIGSIPPELANLAHLQLLSLYNNQLSGSIPTNWNSLTELQWLSLADNQFTGPIPANWNNLTNLQVLHMQSNQLSGSIPPQLGNLTNILTIDFSNNQLSGDLPSSLINLTKLDTFYFNNTNLCEPGDATFQAWLASISNLGRTGVICTASPTNTFTPTPTPTNTAPLTCVTFNVTLNGQQEVPPNTSTATGTATVQVNTTTNTLNYTISFNGLAGTEIAAHIHGFAASGVNAPVLFNLPMGNPKVGSGIYQESQEANILAGLTYINIHSTAFSSGEIRGQIASGIVGCSVPTATPTPTAISTATPVPPASPATSITAGINHTCTLTSVSTIKCWGNNAYGQLGDGTTTDRLTPVDVIGLSSGVIAVSSGQIYTCVIVNNGGVKCWGYNGAGQLGDGTTTDRLTPVDVTGLSSGATVITTGDVYVCAVANNGGVKCWGRSYEESGGSTVHNTPVNIAGLSNGMMAVSSGSTHSCALTNGGAVKCWGWNHAGQLGDGTEMPHNTPVDVSGLGSGVKDISTGWMYTCALTNGGAVKCWGNNADGQLGDGTTIERHIPVDVIGLNSGVIATSTSRAHTCALMNGGAVKCWGKNTNGQLGDGTTTDRLTPVDVTGLSSGVKDISTGGGHTCALMTNGAVKCWGSNADGQLGDGTMTNRLTPVDVVGLGGGATSYSISGKVIDNSSSCRSDVTVTTNTGKSTISNATGNYTISGLTAGTYTLTASKASCTLSTVPPVTVPPDRAEINFTGTSTSGPKTWTLMFYNAGDNDLNDVLTEQYTLLAEASDNPFVNVVLFWDGFLSEARYDVFSSNVSIPKGETNTGDPATLQDFIRWARQNYPATHYALIISDHGHGLSGVAQDQHTPGDNPAGDALTPKELSQALLPFPKFDIIYMDACLMGNIESAYQLIALTDYYVASESVTWGLTRVDWFITGSPVTGAGQEILPITESTAPSELAMAMAESYVFAHRRTDHPSTVSVAYIPNVGDVKDKASQLAGLIRTHMIELIPALHTIKNEVQHYEENGDGKITGEDRVIDLYHFADLVQTHISNPDIQGAAQQVKIAILNYVKFNEAWSGTPKDKHGLYQEWNHSNSHGVSIFFPPTLALTTYYRGDWLDFAVGTNWQGEMLAAHTASNSIAWGQMLVDYIRQVNPNAPVDSSPPALVAPLISLQQVYLPLVQR